MLYFTEVRAYDTPTSDLSTLVFIDYESLYWGLTNHCGEFPDLTLILSDIKSRCKLADQIKVFGDFSKPEMKRETAKIRTITNNIVNCEHASTVSRKNFTDFIMLDHIYQSIIRFPDVEQYVFITGDGHFQSVATFIRTYMDKVVGVYGIEGCLSSQLANCSSWVVQIEAQNAFDQQFLLQRDLVDLIYSAELSEKKAMFKKTVQIAVDVYRQGDFEFIHKYSNALKNLIDNNFVTQTSEPSLTGNNIATLYVDYPLCKEHGLID